MSGWGYCFCSIGNQKSRADLSNHDYIAYTSVLEPYPDLAHAHDLESDPIHLQPHCYFNKDEIGSGTEAWSRARARSLIVVVFGQRGGLFAVE